jgi:uncharacterized protein
MEPIAPTIALAGGLLIGFAAAGFLLLSGRIAGISGMIAVAARISGRGTPWMQSIAFLIGIPLGAWIVANFVRQPQIMITTSAPMLIAAGLLVGFGTRLGNGCTSGHGVCGVARLSTRSLAATATFMASGIASTFIMRHLVGA